MSDATVATEAEWTHGWAPGGRCLPTTFTDSEFGRTLTGATASDHAWGSKHLLMGGAVQGGRYCDSAPETGV